MEDKNLIQSKKVFDTLVSAMEELNLNFGKDEEKLTVHFSMDSNDLPVSHLFTIDSEMLIARYFSPLPFNVPNENLPDVALAVAITNGFLKDGCFDLDMTSGMIIFKLTTCFQDSMIGKGYFKHALMLAHVTVDQYNDKLQQISEGKMSVEEYLRTVMDVK